MAPFYRLIITSIITFSTCLYSIGYAQVSGTVFRDFNADGIQQQNQPGLSEPGIAGVLVNVYDSENNIIASYLSGNNGLYFVPSSGGMYSGVEGSNTGFLAPGRSARLEFEIPPAVADICGLKDGADFSGFNGAAYGSSVQFVQGGDDNIHFAIQNPDDFRINDNPTIFIPCFVNGDPLAGGNSGTSEWFVAFPYSNINTDMPSDKLDGRVLGSVHGTVYSRQAKRVFTSAFLKRHTGLGVLGSGGIYSIAYNENGTFGAIQSFYNLDANGYPTRYNGSQGALAYGSGTSFSASNAPMNNETVTYLGPIDPVSGAPAGLGVIGTNTERGLSPSKEDESHDPAAFDQVGKVGLGDLVISDDGRFLFVTNLYSRKVLRLELNNPYNPTSVVNIVELDVPEVACNNGLQRPFGLKFYKGKLYVGSVCTGENGGVNIINGNTDLFAQVFELNEATSANPNWTDGNILDFPLNYRKGTSYTLGGCGGFSRWKPWTNTFQTTCNLINFRLVWEQPILSDIEFSDDGSIILGFMDRMGHQAGGGNVDLVADEDEEEDLYFTSTGGDILKVFIENDEPCSYRLEKSSDRTNAQNNNQGPDGGEFFLHDFYDNHHETAQGALLWLPGTNEIVTTVMDPIAINSGGLKWLSTQTGITNKNYQLFAGVGDVGLLGKANGLGAMDFSRDLPPLEIGNRVWLDINQNGIQDAEEPGIDGIVLELFLNNVKVGETLSSQGGQYYFNSNNVNLNGASEILPQTAYEIRVAMNQAPLEGLELTIAFASSPGQSFVRDNNAVLNGMNAVIAFTSGQAGHNDHTLDIGFLPASNCPELPDAPDNVVIVDSECNDCILENGSIEAPTNACPEGSELQYSTDAGTTWTTVLPIYDIDDVITIITRCACISDPAQTSPASSPVSTNPELCPEFCICPDWVGPPTNVEVVNSTCNNCVFEGGMIIAPSNPCPPNSAIEYSIDGGVSWTEVLPEYNNNEPLSITTRCKCLADPTDVSPSSTPIETSPEICGPECEPIACEIIIENIVVNPCDPITDTYGIEVFVTYSASFPVDPTTSVVININGNNFSVAQGTNLSTSFLIGNLPANGMNQTVTAQLLINGTICSDSDNYDAPPACSTNPCLITLVSAIPSPCEPFSSTYELSVTLTYTIPDAGTFSINGQDFPVEAGTGITQTFVLNDLDADGEQGINIIVNYSEDTSCSALFEDAYDAPEPCEPTCPGDYEIDEEDITIDVLSIYTIPICLDELSVTITIEINNPCEFFFNPNLLDPDFGGLEFSIEETGDDFITYTVILVPGTYTWTFTYTNPNGVQVSISTEVEVDIEPNEPAVITMPEDTEFVIAYCAVQNTMFEIVIVDDCDDPINPDNASFTLCAENLPFQSFDASTGTFTFEIPVTIELDKCLLTAMYTDSDGNISFEEVEILVTGTEDNTAPVIIYPANDITLQYLECEDVQTYCFYVTAVDDCDGDVPVIVMINGVVFNPIPGTNSYCIEIDGEGILNVLIEASDSNGNTRFEDFRIIIEPSDSPDVSLACIAQVNVSLNAACSALITPQMLLNGNFGCLTDEDFRITINGVETNVVTECGIVEYKIEQVLPENLEGFVGGFAPSEWSVETIGAVGPNTGLVVSPDFQTATLTLQATSGNPRLNATVNVPADGLLSFDWDFTTGDANWTFFLFRINAISGTITVVEVGNSAAGGTTGGPATADGSVIDLALEAGDVLLFSLGNNVSIGATTTVNLTNWVFDFDQEPLFEMCCGTILVEDKRPPQINASCEDMDQALIGFYIINGQWNNQAFNYNTCLNSIVEAGTPGNQTNISYATITFTVPVTGEYFIDMGNNPQIAAANGFAPGNGVDFYLTGNSVGILVQGTWNPNNPCANVIAGGNTGSQVDAAHPGYLATLTAGQQYQLVSWDIAGFDVQPILPGFPTANVFFTSLVIPVGATQACVISCDDVASLLAATTMEDLRALGIPDPIISDNCGVDDADLSFMVGPVSSNDVCEDRTITITYFVQDICGNIGTAERVIEVSRDNLETICGQLRNYDGLDLPAISCTDTRLAGPIGGQWLDANGNPRPEWTGAPANQSCNIQCAYTDINIPLCGVDVNPAVNPRSARKVFRTWTCVDWCIGGTSGAQVGQCAQIIKIKDDVAPIVTPRELTLKVMNNNDCSYEVVFTAPNVQESCSQIISLSISINGGTPQPFVNGFWPSQTLQPVSARRFNAPVGMHEITYIAVDECGNVGEFTEILELEDKTPPIAICESFRVASLGSDCRLRIFAEAFDDGSYDNCGPVLMDVRRMLARNENGQVVAALNPSVDCYEGANFNARASNYNTYRDWVEFCCIDMDADPVSRMVEFRVRDAAGNANTCMVTVEVQDKIAPTGVRPPDVTIDCNDPILHFDFTNLSAAELSQLNELFGDVIIEHPHTVPTARRPVSVAVNNPRIDEVQSGFEFLDGRVWDNCGGTACFSVEQTVNFNLEDCSAGILTRTWRASDNGGNVFTLVQRITVLNYYPFMGGPMVRQYNPVGYFTTFRQQAVAADNLDPRTWPRFEPTSPQMGFQNPFSAAGNFRTHVRAVSTQYPTRFDVIWPADLEIDICDQGIHPDALEANRLYRTGARPYLWRNDACTQAGVSYDEWNFDFEAGCSKIIRKWKIIDWCQQQSVLNPWTWEQVIKIVDTDGPEIVSISAIISDELTEEVGCGGSTTFEFIDECEGAKPIQVRIVGTDPCAAAAEVNAIRWDWEVYPFGDRSNPIRRSSFPGENFVPRSDTLLVNRSFPRTLPGGPAHVMKVIAEDGCGNKTACEFSFRIEDRKKPTPIAFTHLSTELMPEGPNQGEVRIMAHLFNNQSVDNCAVSRFRLGQFTMPGQDIYTAGPRHLRTPVNTHESIVFTCKCPEVLPAGVADCDALREPNPSGLRLVVPGERVFLSFWVGDEYGNWDYTTVSVTVDDNMGADCDDAPSSGVAGIVTTIMNDGVSFVYVGESQEEMTDASGEFYVMRTHTPMLTIRPERLDNPRNGVNVADILAIQRHILGHERITSPYYRIAADVNNDKRIDASDLIDIRRVLLGLRETFTNNTSWRFVPSAYEFLNADQAEAENFPEYIAIPDFQDELENVDFFGIKVGDVNNSVTPNDNLSAPLVSRNNKWEWLITDRYVQAGELIRIPVRSASQVLAEGYQLTWFISHDMLAYQSVEAAALTMHSVHMGQKFLEDGMLTSVWYQSEPVAIDFNEILFELVFSVKQSGQLSDMIRIGSGYTEELAIVNGIESGIDLRFTQEEVTSAAFELYQNRPNPFASETWIGFMLPEAMSAQLSIFDVTGRLVKLIEGDFGAGKNNIIIKRSELPASGVLYYQLEAGDFRASKKMIIIE